MPKNHSLLRRCTAALLLAGLPFAVSAEVVATVNGKAIERADVEAYKQENAEPQAASDQQVIDELIVRELIYQDALTKNLENKPVVQEELAEARRGVLLNAAIRNALESNPVTDAELKKIYEEQATKFDITEYKARHILVKDKAEAEALIKDLKQGAEFAALAEEHSTGPSGKNGGDLGWFAPQQMVPPFSQAVQQLKKGEVTDQPVQTQFGWHVIKLEDTRKPEPPSFEEVKPRLEQAVQQQRVADYLLDLRNRAKIEIK